MRKSVFNGSFYPAGKSETEEFIKNAIKKADIPKEVNDAISYVVPHAGYMYSGKTAAFTYKAMKSSKMTDNTETIIVVGPNHTGIGTPISISIEDWETPFGKASNDKELSKAIAANSEYLQIDEAAHKGEHSIEVQLPFLQYLFPEKRFVFVCMGDQSLAASELLSDAIIKAAEILNRKVLVVASSDFNHYESAEVAKRKDSKLLEAVKTLDHKNFNRLVDEVHDTACGFGPITVAMLFAKDAGMKKGTILKYTNSGEETGDYSSVVAYCSIAFA